MRGRVLAVAVLMAVALTACGEDREGTVEQGGAGTGTSTTGTTPTETSPAETSPAPSGPVAATIEVKETEYRLDPENPRVKEPGVVKFEVSNAGKIGHALEVEGPGGEVETEEIAPGESATLEADLDKPGRYKWYCPIADHEQDGMVGEIRVGGVGAGSVDDSGGAAGDSGAGGY